MRRIILILISIIVISVSFPVFAGQKTYRQSSDEVQTLFVLSRISSTALPQMTYPVTEDNLVFLLSKIDSSKLNGSALQMYRDLQDRLENRKVLVNADSVVLDFRIPVLIGEVWNNNSFLPFRDRLPLIEAKTEISITDYFTLYSVFDFKADKTVYSEAGDIKIHSLYNIRDLSHEYPSTAYGSFGNKTFNLIIGRDRMSAGDGITGNLELSQNLLFQDFAKFSVMKGPVSYDFTVLAYDNPVDSATDIRRYNFNDPFKAAYIHRISGVIRNKVTTTLFQGLMTYGEHTFSDPRVLNPFMMIHNTFTFMNGNANNFFGLEVSVALPFGMKFDAQALLDQFKLGSESSDSGQNALGFLANLSGSWVLGDGILSAYAEGVYNNPYLYLIEETNPDIPNLKKWYQLDLVSAYKYFADGDYEQNYIGYPLGGDVKVLAAGASYLWNGIKLSADAVYSIKGGHGIADSEERIAKETSKPEENTLSVSGCVSGKVNEALSFRAKLGYSRITGYGHVSGAQRSGIRFAVGFTVDPVSLISR